MSDEQCGGVGGVILSRSEGSLGLRGCWARIVSRPADLCGRTLTLGDPSLRLRMTPPTPPLCYSLFAQHASRITPHDEAVDNLRPRALAEDEQRVDVDFGDVVAQGEAELAEAGDAGDECVEVVRAGAARAAALQDGVAAQALEHLARVAL